MTKGTFVEELALSWEKLKYLLGLLMDLLRGVATNPGSVTKGTLIMLGAVLLIVVLIVTACIVRFITEPWKKKGEALLTLLVFLIVLAVILFFVLRAIEVPGL
jgi:dolichyl-phosphate-mannose--protein O-mannosyl transferase